MLLCLLELLRLNQNTEESKKHPFASELSEGVFYIVGSYLSQKMAQKNLKTHGNEYCAAEEFCF